MSALSRPGFPPTPGGAPLVRWLALAAFGAYGVSRWGNLLAAPATLRLAGLAAAAFSLAGLGSWIEPRVGRWYLLLGLPGFAAILLIAGWPVRWVLGLKLALIWRSVGRGLDAVPGVLVPYNGVDAEVRATILLGAGALLLLAALAVPARRSHRAGTALALLALLVLAVFPGTLLHPNRPLLQGVLLFGLLAGFLWAGRRDASPAGAVGLLAVAGAIALPLADALTPAKPLLDPARIAQSLLPRHLATFSWNGDYGPLHWPRSGTTVLSVIAPSRQYLKTENLDDFNGVGWVAATHAESLAAPIPGARTRARFTHTLSVSVGAMSSREIVVAGQAAAPQGIPGVQPAISPGTWLAPRGLTRGQSYRVRVYTPQPSRAELRAAPPDPAEVLTAERTVQLTDSGFGGATYPVSFSQFGRGPVRPRLGIEPGDATAVVAHSAYGGAYALARRLAAGRSDQLAVVRSVEAYLHHGYRYTEHTRYTLLPLVSFLRVTRAGYCQHFAGAMALLLRLDGVPARVATGFTGGVQQPGGPWLVQDLDAHAWVEVHFAGIGWVTFDPTPAADPALAGVGGDLDAAEPAVRTFRTPRSSHGFGATGPLSAGGAHAPTRRTDSVRPSGGLSPWPWPAAPLVLLLAGAATCVRLREPTVEARLAELERALRRTGRTQAARTTLLGLERRIGAGEAGEYLHALRRSRYAGEPLRISRAQRRALRRELVRGLGPIGRLRGWWLLKPRFVLLHST